MFYSFWVMYTIIAGSWCSDDQLVFNKTKQSNILLIILASSQWYFLRPRLQLLMFTTPCSVLFALGWILVVVASFLIHSTLRIEEKHISSLSEAICNRNICILRNPQNHTLFSYSKCWFQVARNRRRKVTDSPNASFRIRTISLFNAIFRDFIQT